MVSQPSNLSFTRTVNQTDNKLTDLLMDESVILFIIIYPYLSLFDNIVCLFVFLSLSVLYIDQIHNGLFIQSFCRFQTFNRRKDELRDCLTTIKRTFLDTTTLLF